jgi:hypothetical protein
MEMREASVYRLLWVGRAGLLGCGSSEATSVGYALPVVAAAVCALGDPQAAVMLAAADDVLCTAHRFELGSLEREMLDDSKQAARRALGDKFEQVWQAGTELDVGAAVELALTTFGS